MTKEQFDGKFIICRTQEEYDFVAYWMSKLFVRTFDRQPHLPIVMRFKEEFPCGRTGFAEVGYWASSGRKEEECSVLFGNLVKRWAYENRV